MDKCGIRLQYKVCPSIMLFPINSCKNEGLENFTKIFIQRLTPLLVKHPTDNGTINKKIETSLKQSSKFS